MRVADLSGKNVVVWGTGIEGTAAGRWIRRSVDPASLIFIDDAAGTIAGETVFHDVGDIDAALSRADIVVKSAGISLHHPRIQTLIAQGKPVTTLLNLWIAQPRKAKTVLVTGSKGKSTTASLVAHALNALGHKAGLAGNIGFAVSELDESGLEFVVVETSSYQAASLDGACDIGVVVSLFPEHLDWHGSVANYYRDKLQVLARARTRIMSVQARDVIAAEHLGDAFPNEAVTVVGITDGFHFAGGEIKNGAAKIGSLANAYLARPHNLEDVCLALAVIAALGLDPSAALRAMESFQGLPHRQFELGEKDGILYVDDSISTTPQSTIAALNVYRGRRLTLIAGGHDRGIDYAPLIGAFAGRDIAAVICMGPSGKRIFDLLQAKSAPAAHLAATMDDAITFARRLTPSGGVILLSPAAPSYGLFKDFIARGKAFAAASDFT